MNVEIFIDDQYEETTVKIYAKTYSKEIDWIKDQVLGHPQDKITAFAGDNVEILAYKDILRFYGLDNKVYLDTMKTTYTTRLRLYQLEDRLPKKQFIKISRSEIVNLDYVKSLDLSFSGTIALELKNGQVTYVSRRSLKNFKEALGL
ncbi:Probable transcriptional regulatory protein YehT [Urinicoccus massiliensis]|uniref:Probable transcriptional regulatory protein YehT n=1 Tax=Urinicoccus massiliensis TaxID=1723382 RepID=A0A8H2M4D2_9FIRM|nr:LytTR family DNA-binding domain-containing protein [Urinicoccus massiliensis]KGF11362.1 histidine kinase [Tissierellia bacterium S5-A11]VFB15683.1 Probable transcriptional regulatory protein YehT [Urinicoccus massiliensis]